MLWHRIYSFAKKILKISPVYILVNNIHTIFSVPLLIAPNDEIKYYSDTVGVLSTGCLNVYGA